MATKISSELLGAYQATEYWVGKGPDAFCLHIDRPSKQLAELLKSNGKSSAAFVTAYNPYSRPCSEAYNTLAHERLRLALKSEFDYFTEGVGQDSAGNWPQENSFLVMGIDLQRAKNLGNQFEQNAIVWSGNDSTPALVLLK